MSQEKAYMETIRLVGQYGDEPLTVGPDADRLGLVRINANSVAAEEYWGKVDVCFTPAIARVLAQALLAAADEVEAA